LFEKLLSFRIMSLIVSGWRKVTQLPLLYYVALMVQAIALYLSFRTHDFGGLRGGIFTTALVLILVWVMSFAAIVQVAIAANLRKVSKLGLVALQSPGLAILAPLTAQTLIIALFFGPGACRTTFSSPSGQHSITIEDACFMGCTHTVYQNYFIFERSLGEIYLNSGKVCTSKAVMKWNESETEVLWRINGQSGLLKLK
jgi:hypothetical protein